MCEQDVSFCNTRMKPWASDSACVIHVDVDSGIKSYRSVKTDDWLTVVDVNTELFAEKRAVVSGNSNGI